TLIINFIRTLPTFIRTCTDECGKCSDEVDNQGRPEKRAAGRESCRFSLVVCYTAMGKSHRRCPIA
ncbi:MAG: hypothetical protein Q3X58_07355, partial [Collinsella sp.]|nr:hypothetical protein [Collinsella sp.]